MGHTLNCIALLRLLIINISEYTMYVCMYVHVYGLRDGKGWGTLTYHAQHDAGFAGELVRRLGKQVQRCVGHVQPDAHTYIHVEGATTSSSSPDLT